ncbi:capsid cement protein [Mycobacterium sp. 155]|uniref:capsid cement protein n=1 Tax=Mycobacterium sp. 155 TaxID=1157943 RepID=UPI00035E777F|nr:capsid cement protein [Mycobacterium sp. 155]
MSTTIANPSVYDPGANITAQATAVVTARTFLAISGNRVSGGNLAVATATAAGRVCGVAGNDAANGGLVTVVRGNSRVVRVTTAGIIAAGAEVEVGAAGKAVTKTAGVAVGYAVTGAASGDDAEISLY